MDIRNMIQSLRLFLKENLAFSIVSLNALLVLTVFLVKDPFGVFASTYQKAPAFFKIKQNEISSIKITNETAKKTFELVNENSKWIYKTSKGNFSADESKTNQFIKSILDAKKFKTLSSSKENLKNFGVDENSVKIEVIGKETQSKGFLKIGSVTPRGSFTHVTFNDEPSVYLVEDNLKASAGRFEEDYFINKKILSEKITLDDILGFSLTFANGSGFSLVKENKNWNLTKPSIGKASVNEVHSFLSKLLEFNSLDLAAEDELKKLKDNTGLEIQIASKVKDAPSETFIVKVVGKTKDDLFIQRQNDPTIYKTRESNLSFVLDKKADSFLETKPENKNP